MTSSLTKEQIEHLHAKLIVPIAINDILNFGLDVEAEMQYGLHEALSEIDPDSALLAIALSAQHIAEHAKASYPIAGALNNEASQIICDYGPEFIRDLKRGSLPEADFIKILETVPEDLEAMADLLDAVSAEIEDEESSIVIICHLLSIQARAHMEIANYILEESGYQDGDAMTGGAFIIQDKEMDYTPLATENVTQQSAGDNIILFPAHLRH